MFLEEFLVSIGTDPSVALREYIVTREILGLHINEHLCDALTSLAERRQHKVNWKKEGF